MNPSARPRRLARPVPIRWAVLTSLLAALVPAGAAELAAQRPDSAAIELRVWSTEGRPLPGALVSVQGTSGGGRTDARGWIRLSPLAPGVYFISVRMLGYRPEQLRANLEAGYVDRWDVRLEPAPIELAEVRVTADPIPVGRLDMLRGFYERRERGVGYFLTREEIERHGSRDLSNILRTVPGLRASPTRMGHSRLSTRGVTTLAGRCEVRVYIDGIVYRAADDLPGISPLDLEGIEVYRGRSEIPAEFADTDADCGVIAIWTRRHRPREP